MHLCKSSICSLPELGIAHRPQEVINLLLLVLCVGLNFQAINLLQNLSLFVQEQLQSELFLLLTEFCRAFDLLSFIKSPSIELIAQDFEVFTFLGVHASLDFFLVLDFLFVSQIGLFRLKFVILVSSFLSQTIGRSSGKPGSHMALNFQRDLLSLFVPHG